MKTSLLALTAIALLLAGCGSTDKGVNPDLVSNETPPQMPESYQTMVDFRIISESDANKVVNGQRQTIENKMANFRGSVAGQLTNDGKMFVGFGLAQLFGGGVALTDFFSPLALLRSTAHENHLTKSFFWVEVDDDCDEECGYQKMYDVLSLAAQHYADNYLKLLSSKIDGIDPGPAILKPLEVVDPPSPKLNMLLQSVSKSYKTDILNLDEQYDVLGNGRPFFTVWDADFITVKGKRYFGSRVTTAELFTVQFHRIGQYSSWWYDNSQTFGLAKASETYPDFIYIETQNFVDQDSADNPGERMRKCQGDLMITKGKVTFMHLFPDCEPVRLEDSNMINAQVHDARSEIFTEEEWQQIMTDEGAETASN